jgi:DNA primase
MEASSSCERARNICIVKTLAKLGHFPIRKSEKEAWFLSPLRSETQASFSVSLIKNLWYDFGIGKGGSAIDLIMALENCSAYEAAQSLQENIPLSFSPEKVSNKRNSVQIKQINKLKHPALIQYLNSRKIPLQIAQIFCHEIWYSLNDKIYSQLD